MVLTEIRFSPGQGLNQFINKFNRLEKAPVFKAGRLTLIFSGGYTEYKGGIVRRRFRVFLWNKNMNNLNFLIFIYWFCDMTSHKFISLY